MNHTYKNKRRSIRRKKRAAKRRTFHFTPTPKVTGVLFGFALVIYSSSIGIKQLMYKTNLFTLKEIKISGLQYLDESIAKNLVRVELNTPLFKIPVEQVSENVLKNNYIRAASVSRVIPSTLAIDIQERKPVLFLLDNSIYMVDETGIILENLPTIPTTGLPIATGISVEKLLQDRRPLYRALDMIQMIREVDKDLLPFVSETHLQKDHFPILFLVKGGAKVLLGDSNLYQRIYLWSNLFKQSSVVTKLNQIEKIDFTFSDRIVIEYKT